MRLFARGNGAGVKLTAYEVANAWSYTPRHYMLSCAQTLGNVTLVLGVMSFAAVIHNQSINIHSRQRYTIEIIPFSDTPFRVPNCTQD